jgi:hypothetical protein
MNKEYRLKVKRSNYCQRAKKLHQDLDCEAVLVIRVNDSKKTRRSRKTFAVLCSSFEIIETQSSGKWNIRFLIEPALDGVTIEASNGFYLESIKRLKAEKKKTA